MKLPRPFLLGLSAALLLSCSAQAERPDIPFAPPVTRAALALLPAPSPSRIPAARAMTFFMAPASSTPVTSSFV